MMAALGLFLALLLAASALHKVLARARLALVTARLAGVNAPLGAVLLAVAATLEGLAALELLVPALQQAGALLAAVLWSAYALALLRHRGKVLDCGCDFAAREAPVGAFAILRPVLLAGLALSTARFAPLGWTLETPFAALALSTARFTPLGWTLETPFAALALCALWFAAAELHSIPAPRRAHS